MSKYKEFNVKMHRLGYYLNHQSWFARTVAALALAAALLMFRAFLGFFPYLMSALNQLRLDSLDKWYLSAVLIAPVIIFLSAVYFIVSATAYCLTLFTRGSFNQPFYPIKGKIEIKRTTIKV